MNRRLLRCERSADLAPARAFSRTPGSLPSAKRVEVHARAPSGTHCPVESRRVLTSKHNRRAMLVVAKTLSKPESTRAFARGVTCPRCVGRSGTTGRSEVACTEVRVVSRCRTSRAESGPAPGSWLSSAGRKSGATSATFCPWWKLQHGQSEFLDGADQADTASA